MTSVAKEGKMTTVRITHFSDILCVWAYIGHIRVVELQANFPREVVFDFRAINVFGDVQTKMNRQWKERGGVAAYAQHVHDVAAGFEHVNLSPDVWRRNVPTSSLPAHLVIAAARLVDETQGSSCAPLYAFAIREAFFRQAIDVSCMTELFAIAQHQGIEVGDLERELEKGRAHALVADDLKSVDEFGVRSSPTMIFNDGRQSLSGNVGYRVLEANIRELIRHPGDQHSWC